MRLCYQISGIPDANLRKAYDGACKLDAELREVAERVAERTRELCLEEGTRLEAWGELTLEELVDRVSKASSKDEKGRALEELCVRLFENVDGFAVTDRLRTATEEIDLTVVNGSRIRGSVVSPRCFSSSARTGHPSAGRTTSSSSAARSRTGGDAAPRASWSRGTGSRAR